MTTKFYLHNATCTLSGTLPTSAQSSTLAPPDVTVTAASTPTIMNSSIGTSQLGPGGNSLANTNPQSMWFRSIVSPPLAAQTLPTGSYTLSLASSQGNTASNFQMTCSLFAWRPSTGARVGSFILDDNPVITAPGTTETAGSASASGTGVTVADGDLLVCEIWRHKIAQSMGTSYLDTFYFDGTTEASATSCASFIQAPANITLLGPDFNYAVSAFNNTTSPKTIAITWNAGDLVLVLAMNEANAAAGGFSTPTFSGGTFVAIDADTSATTTKCRGSSWQCTPAAGGSGNVSASDSTDGTRNWGFMVIVVAAGSHNGIGVHGNPSSSNVFVQSLTVAANSAVVALLGDFAATSPTGRAWTPSDRTEIVANTLGGFYTWYGGAWNGQASGTRNYGITGITSTGLVTRLYVEIKAAAVAGGTPLPALRYREQPHRSRRAPRARYAA